MRWYDWYVIRRATIKLLNEFKHLYFYAWKTRILPFVFQSTYYRWLRVRNLQWKKNIYMYICVFYWVPKHCYFQAIETFSLVSLTVWFHGMNRIHRLVAIQKRETRYCPCAFPGTINTYIHTYIYIQLARSTNIQINSVSSVSSTQVLQR